MEKKPKDNETQQNKILKLRDFIIARGEAMYHLSGMLSKEFAESPEGKEAAYLMGIVRHYLNKIDNFLRYVLSGEPGNKGINHIINGLQHPDSEVKPDEKLIKALEKFAKEIEKIKVPDWKELKHYHDLKEKVTALKPIPDIHEFIGWFKGLLREAMLYEETSVAKTIKEKSPKKIPHSIELEDFEFAVTVWKYILSKLYEPEEAARAREIFGSETFEGAEEKMATKLNKSIDDFRKEVAACFPEEREKGITNLTAFSAKVADEGDKNIFMILLKGLGQARYANIIAKEFGKKGHEIADPMTVKHIALVIKKLGKEDVREKIEIAARDELTEMITALLRTMRKSIEGARDDFRKILVSRIDDLKKDHAKKLKEIEDMEKKLASETKNTLYVAAAGHNIVEEVVSLLKSQNGYCVREADILALYQTRLAFSMFQHGNIDQTKLDANIAEVMFKRPSEFAVNIINHMRSLFTKAANNEISAEEFTNMLKRIDEAITSLGKQIEAVVHGQKMASDKIVELSRKGAAYNRTVESDLQRISKLASANMEDIHNMGVDEKYRHELSPEDLETLRQ
jgi:hypothetical protein